MRIHIRFIALFLVAIAGAAAFRIYHDSIVEGETHTRARVEIQRRRVDIMDSHSKGRHTHASVSI